MILFRGVDVDLGVKLFKTVKVGTFISYIDPRDKTARISCLTGKTYIKADLFSSIKIKLEAEHSHDRFDANDRQVRLADYFIINSGISYSTILMDVDSSIYLDIENMFDKKYEVKDGYPVAGFLIKGGVLLKI